MIHRAIFGSLERFMGILIENFAGEHVCSGLTLHFCRNGDTFFSTALKPLPFRFTRI